MIELLGRLRENYFEERHLLCKILKKNYNGDSLGFASDSSGQWRLNNFSLHQGRALSLGKLMHN